MKLPVLGSTPWRRAPLLLLRRPGVLLAVTGAAAILGTATAATPLFLSSAGNAALHHQIDSACYWNLGPSVSAQQLFGSANANPQTQGQPLPSDVRLDSMTQLRDDDAAVRRAAAAIPHLGAPLRTMNGTAELTRVSGGRGTFLNRLVTRPGAEQHVTVLQHRPGRGLWITDTTATAAGLGVGDQVRVSSDTGAVTLPVVAVYRNLASEPERPFWCSLHDAIFPPGAFAEHRPPPLALVDDPTFLATANALKMSADTTWEAPLGTARLTTKQAGAVSANIKQLQDRLLDDTSPFRRLGSYRLETGAAISSALPRLVDRATAVRDALRRTTRPVALAAILVALLLVAAAGGYWVDRRRREVDLLVSRGIGPVPLAVKAGLEMAPATLVGGALGWVLALGLTRLIAPSPLLSSGVPAAALLLTVPVVVLAVLLLALVAAIRTRAASEHPLGRRRSRLAYVPWELILLGAAIALLAHVLHGRTATNDVDGVAQVSPLLLAFPLLFLVGAIGVAVRLAALVLPRLRRSGHAWAVPAYLAARRLGGARAVALLLLAAAALPIGVLVYSAAMTQSSRATIDAKLYVFLGSDVVASVSPGTQVPPSLAGTVTAVGRSPDAQVDGRTVELLAVDPATFADQAYWNDTFAGASLRTLMQRIREGEAGTSVPAVAVGAPASGHVTLSSNDTRHLGLDFRAVGTAKTFPGQRGTTPMLVVPRAALERIDAPMDTQFWGRGDEKTIEDALTRARVPVTYAVVASSVLDQSRFLAVTWTFGYLQALGVLTGLIALGGLLLYLETRARARTVSYAMSRRMGLSRRTHLASLLVELGTVLGLGLALGGTLAWAAAVAVHGRLDVDPFNPPRPLLPVPWPALIGALIGMAVIVVSAAFLAQRSADRARPSEVLRVA